MRVQDLDPCKTRVYCGASCRKPTATSLLYFHIAKKKDTFVYLGATSNIAQVLVQALCSGITPSGVQGTICGIEVWSLVGHVQYKLHTCCNISLDWEVLFKETHIFGVIPILCSVNTTGSVTIWAAGISTEVDHTQGKYSNPYTISPLSNNSWGLCSHYLINSQSEPHTELIISSSYWSLGP